MVHDNQLSVVSLPGGVADPKSNSGYVTNLIDAIEALDLSNGESRWRAEIKGRPVATVAESVLAITASQKQNELQIIALAKTGGSIEQLASIVFPDWVVTSITPDDSFNYRIETSNDDVVINWQAQERYRGGAPPSSQLVSQLHGNAGTVRFNPSSSSVEMSERSSETIELPKAARDSITFPYQRGASTVWHNEPWAFDDQFAIIIGALNGDQQSLSLLKWHVSDLIADSATSLVTDQALVSFVTTDGLFVFIHSELNSSNEAWWVFSVRTGEKITTIRHEAGAREPCVLGSKIYYLLETPPPSQRTSDQIVTLSLKSVEVQSGTLLWESYLSERTTRPVPRLRQ